MTDGQATTDLPLATQLPVRVVKSYPLITVSKTYSMQPMGVAQLLAEHVPGRQSLNFIQLTWSYEATEKVDTLVNDIIEAKNLAPGAEFVILANTEFESFLLSERGVPNILASETIFIDEQVFRPHPQIERAFEAVYNGRLAPMKRHELGDDIKQRLLIYSYEWAIDAAYSEALRARPSSAVFLNHHLGGGEYKHLDRPELVKHLNSACVGLCLSATEGIMRASIEYLLCGLPVVSTPCYGGRERYYHPDYCRIVEPEAAAVADAVSELISENIDPYFIRRRTLSIINRERTNFLRFVNSIVRNRFNIRNLFADFEPFRGNVDHAEVERIADRLKGKPGA